MSMTAYKKTKSGLVETARLVDVETKKDALDNIEVLFPGDKNAHVRDAHIMIFICHLELGETPLTAYEKMLVAGSNDQDKKTLSMKL